jgi:hypothetical protein
MNIKNSVDVLLAPLQKRIKIVDYEEMSSKI